MGYNGNNSQLMHVIKASAGSGKTYTLALTYIVNLLGIKQHDGRYRLRKTKEYHRHILAITFTNKATDEMKARIVKQLHLLSLGKGDYKDFFIANFIDDFESVKLAAAKALGDILFNYNSFAVNTIDSFFQLILRTFAREVDYDNGYEIELDNDVALQAAVHDFLLDLTTGLVKPGSKIYRWIKDYVRFNIDNSNSWNFFGSPKSLVTFATNINKEFFREASKEIQEYFGDMDDEGLSKVEQFRKSIITRRNEQQELYKTGFTTRLIDLMRQTGAQESDLHGSRFFAKLLKGDVPKTWKDNVKYTTEIENLKSLFKGNLYERLPISHLELYLQLVRDMYVTFNRIALLDALLKNIWQLGLLGVIDKKLHDNMRDSNTMLLSDTGEMIHEILTNGNNGNRASKASKENTSFVYERIGTQFHNYMIDEFQDTSHKQYENFMPLLDESTASGNEALIIGDEKQAIYRFRNSDPSMLREELETDYPGVFYQTTLDNNFRSFETIVNFNNALFQIVPKAWFAKFPTLLRTYSNVRQNVKKDKRKGFVRIDFVPYDKHISETVPAILQQLPERIYSILQRGFRLKDIMILVNRNNQANVVVNYLMAYNAMRDESLPELNLISEESLLIKNSPAVRTIINVLRFIESTLIEPPAQAATEEEQKEIDRRVKRLLQNQQRYKLIHDYGKAKVRLNREEQDTTKLLEEIADQHRQQAALSIPEAIAQLAEVTLQVLPDIKTQPMHLSAIVDKIILNYITLNDGTCPEHETAFITAFQDVVLQFAGAGSNGGTVREFLRYWDEKSRSLAIPASALDAIEVMSIHKAKGLEAPVVIMPFADWDLAKFSSRDTLWLPKQRWMSDNASGSSFLNLDEECVPPLVPIPPSNLANEPEFADFYNTELEKTLIDNLNKTYVAFTRPRQELHIWTPGAINSKREQVTATPEMLQAFADTLIKNDGKLQVQGQEDDCSEEIQLPLNAIKDENDVCCAIELGQAETKADEENRDDSSFDIPVEATIELPAYRVTPLTETIKVSLPDTPSLPQREGNAMHRLLSMIRDSRDVDYAIAMASESNLFKGEEAFWTLERAVALVSSIVDDPKAKSWFDPKNKVLNERTIIVPDDRSAGDDKPATAKYRPDRIVITPDRKAIVIDYKFGKDYRAATLDHYRKQVSDYMKLLKRAGYNDVEGYLWFFRDKKNPIREVIPDRTL